MSKKKNKDKDKIKKHIVANVNNSNNNDTIAMKKYYNREEQFTYDEKVYVCAKSDDKCCHCGKKIFPDFGLTIDHFIPLNKGGSNRFINLIPLCKDCNEEKDDKLYPITYIKYIKDKYKKELEGYVDSYVHVTDFAQRNRILAYDEYTYDVDIIPSELKKFKGVFNKSKIKIKLATWNTYDKILEYFTKYLKKYDNYTDENAVRENISFWMNFGCIYYVEKNSEITIMFVITIKQMDNKTGYRGILNIPHLYIFPYYNTDVTVSIVYDLMYKIPHTICDENNLLYIPVNAAFLKEDKTKFFLSKMLEFPLYPDATGFFDMMTYIDSVKYKKKYGEQLSEDAEVLPEEQNIITFFNNKFSDITDLLMEYFIQIPEEDRNGFGWMVNNLISADLLKHTELYKLLNYKDNDENKKAEENKESNEEQEGD